MTDPRPLTACRRMGFADKRHAGARERRQGFPRPGRLAQLSAYSNYDSILGYIAPIPMR